MIEEATRKVLGDHSGDKSRLQLYFDGEMFPENEEALVIEYDDGHYEIYPPGTSIEEVVRDSPDES